MENFTTVIVVLAILVALLAVADKFKLPNPVLLVVCGLGIGFIPSIPSIALDPEVVFLIFLPPVLYDAASNTSWPDFRSEIKNISMLAIALVIITTGGVAVTSHALIPGFSWPLAFVLGAIVSPPDAVAATTITKGLGLNRKVVTILEGESLVNDASALIAYRFAIAAIATGSFALWQATIDFVLVVAGGVLIGAAVGGLFIIIHKRILNNSIISTSLSLLTPFLSYLAAEHMHVSGVLSVVSSGIIISWRASDIFSYQTRLRHRAVWDTIIFLLNGCIFILIGLQLRSILDDLGEYGIQELVIYGIVVSAITILIRIVWVFGTAVLPAGNNRAKHPDDSDSSTWKNVAIVAWTGTRGVVSLATALALPLTINGTPFPHRSLILFLAFVVIFVTLVIQGLSLPLLLKLLKIKHQDFSDNEERQLRLSITQSVVEFIDHELADKTSEVVRNQIRKQYTDMIESLSKNEVAANTSAHKSVSGFSPVSELLQAQSEINRFQRQLLISYHKGGNFNHATIRQLEQKLDYEELLFRRMQRGR